MSTPPPHRHARPDQDDRGHDPTGNQSNPGIVSALLRGVVRLHAAGEVMSRLTTSPPCDDRGTTRQRRACARGPLESRNARTKRHGGEPDHNGQQSACDDKPGFQALPHLRSPAWPTQRPPGSTRRPSPLSLSLLGGPGGFLGLARQWRPCRRQSDLADGLERSAGRRRRLLHRQGHDLYLPTALASRASSELPGISPTPKACGPPPDRTTRVAGRIVIGSDASSIGAYALGASRVRSGILGHLSAGMRNRVGRGGHSWGRFSLACS
jgi:hypothetical protein